MKKLFLLSFFINIFYSVFSQLTINASNEACLPAGKSFWIGNAANSGNRLRMYNDGTDAYIDYSTNLYLRNTSLSNMCKFTNYINSYPWSFSKYGSDPCIYVANQCH